MLNLTGIDAAVMCIAKAEVAPINGTRFEMLRAAMAVLCGLTSPGHVEEGDVLQAAANLHDKLTEASLIQRPASAIASALISAQYVAQGAGQLDGPTLLFRALLGNIAVTRVVSETGVRLVDWTGSRAKVMRTWHYVQSPDAYEMAPCDCGNTRTQWSEYSDHLWCDRCQKDFVPAHPGVLGGPVLLEVSAALGICFDRVNLETNRLERFDLTTGTYLKGAADAPPP